jgi:ribosomal protein S18 acetylase RimI-like enzyme
MPAVRLVPFEERHLPEAAALLADRHRRHRLVEPLLPDVDDFEEQVARDWRHEGASGAVALDGDEVAGYLIGYPREDPAGTYVWIDLAGHAAREPELVRDLYQSAAAAWVEAGLKRHMVFVPALRELVEPWSRLSFGVSAALAARETAIEPEPAPGITVRASLPADLERVAMLATEMAKVLAASPSFSGHAVPTAEESDEEWSDTWDDPRFTHFVAEHRGEIAGELLLYRRPEGDLRVPPSSIDLAHAATEPSLRGTGVGLALTAHALSWANAHGYDTMITDWRMTNLLASRFWPRRGFRETFLRLYRSIP